MTYELHTLCAAFQCTAGIDPAAVALRAADVGTQYTWGEYAEHVRRIAGGLAALGVRRGDTVALMMGNSPEFHVADTAAMHLGAATFSIYNTGSPEQIAHVLSHAAPIVVVCERQYEDRLRDAGGDAIEYLLILEDGDVDALQPAPDFDFDAAWRAVQPDDVLTLIYTSGTTGPPKGVEITHANVAAQLDAFSSVLDFRLGDTAVSYLPMAHIAERLITHYGGMTYGVEVTSVADMREIGSVLTDVRPTIFGAVPRVWEKMKAKIDAAVANDASMVKRRVYKRALDLGYRRVWAVQDGRDLDPVRKVVWQLADATVLSKVRAELGLDRMRWAMSGSAAIPAETLEFFMALGLNISEVWGMSECGCATANPPGTVKVGTVGKPLPGVEVRVATDGELVVRGGTVMRGYRNDAERTAETMSDGWLLTGDIAEIDDDGYISIVDRKKELIINAAGKNMSPSNIENAVKVDCPLIGGIAVIGDGRSYNTALIVLDPETVSDFVSRNGIADSSPETLVKYPAVCAEIDAAVAAGNTKLARVEQIKRYEILPLHWEPGGDEVTPTMKLKRKAIATKYADAIDRLYATKG